MPLYFFRGFGALSFVDGHGIIIMNNMNNNMNSNKNNINNTQYFRAPVDATLEVSQILERVYKALAEKGYNPVNQIVGYIMSGDPTYITSHNNARSLIMRVERDELIEEALTYYINSRFINNNRKQI